MRVMHDMELDDEDKMDQVLPIAMDRPDYPCELRISLTPRVLKKLGLDTEEAVKGGMVHGFFMARVTNVSNPGHDDCCIELQIEDLGIESEDEENEE